MIKEFVNRFRESEREVRARLVTAPPKSYEDVVRAVVETVSAGELDGPDPRRIHQIDDGDYQGTLVFVIAGRGYQPSDYWYVKVYYGSCSGCDTLEGIRGYSDDAPSPQQVDDYWTLALHVAQGLRPMQATP